MRVRKRKGAEEHLANHPQYVILEPEAAKGKWHQIFGNDNPIHIEVGSGKGAFITGMAQQNPDINYIGIDIQLSVLSYALDKVLASGVENVKLLRVDGSALTNYFEDGYEHDAVCPQSAAGTARRPAHSVSQRQSDGVCQSLYHSVRQEPG